MRDRGSALLTSVIAIMVLLAISGVFFSIVNYQSKLETSEEKGLRAYYLAEAGINYGVAQMYNKTKEDYKNDPNNPFNEQSSYMTGSEPLPFPNKDTITPLTLGDNDPGTFYILIKTYPSTDKFIFTVTSTANYPNEQGITRVLQEQYSIPKT